MLAESIACLRNQPRRQDMVAHAFGRFDSTGFILPPAQREIYRGIARATGRKSILEVGCGIGAGANILRGQPFIYKDTEAVHRIIIATDRDVRHVCFAEQLYPFIPFGVYDVCKGPYPAKLYDAVVAVEVLEHVEDPLIALKNMALSCREEVWVSTPNRQNPSLAPHGPPHNKHHVQEFTPREILKLGAPFFSSVQVLDSQLCPVDLASELTPLVYHFTL